jgi:autotransporter-associated beta strand protein
MRYRIAAMIVLVTAVAAPSRAQTITLNPYFDTYITQYQPSANKSTSTSLRVSAQELAGTIYPLESALLQFDLSALHPHDYIDHAELSMQVNQINVQSGSLWVGVFPVNRFWWPTANWNMAYSTGAWGEAGGESVPSDRDGTPDANQYFYPSSAAGRYTWTSTGLIDTVQDWVSGERGNYGWMMRASDISGTTARLDIEVASNEALPSARPELFAAHHREPIDWRDDVYEGTWDTSSQNWEWIVGNTHYVEGTDPDEVRFSNGSQHIVNIDGTVRPRSVSITGYDYTFRGGAIGGDCDVSVGGGGTVWLEAANSFTGDLTVESGTVIAAANYALGDNTPTRTVRFHDGATLVFSDVNYTASHTVYVSGDGPTSVPLFQGAVANTGNSSFAGNIYLEGDSTFDILDGRLTLTNTIAKSGGGQVTLTVRGWGALDLRNSSTITGHTVISEGTTLLAGNSTGYATGYGLTTVQSMGTLGGDGEVYNVSVEAGGIIQPGDGDAGWLAVRDLTLADTSRLDFDLYNWMLGDQNDRLIVRGDLVLDGLLDITLLDPGLASGQIAGRYTIAVYGGALDDRGLTIGNATAGWVYTIDTTTTPGYVYLNVEVPEPASLALMGVGGLLIAKRRRG